MNKMKASLISFILCISFTCNLSAAPQKKYIGKSDGLANNSVSLCYSDSKGYLWIGSWGGLDRYDGLEVKNFNRLENGSSIGDPLVHTILEQEDGIFWVGTHTGIDKLDLNIGTWTNYGPEHWFKEFNRGPLLDISPENRVFCVSVFGGLSYYDKKTDSFKDIELPSSITEDIMAFRCIENEEMILLMKDGSVRRLRYHVEKDSVIADGISDYINGDNYYSMFSSGSHILFVSKDALILHNLDDNSFLRCQTDRLPVVSIGYFCQHGNESYITCEGRILRIEFEHNRVSEVQELQKQISRSIFFDSKGLAWIGTGNNGLLCIYNDNVFNRCVIERERNIPPIQTSSIVEDSFANIYSCAVGKSTLFRNGRPSPLPGNINPENADLIQIIPSSVKDDFFLVFQNSLVVASAGKEGIESVQKLFHTDTAIHIAAVDTFNNIIYLSSFGKELSYYSYEVNDGKYKLVEDSRKTYLEHACVLELFPLSPDGTLLVSELDHEPLLFNGKTGVTEGIEIVDENGHADSFSFFRGYAGKERIWAITKNGLSLIHLKGNRFTIERTLDISHPVKQVIEGKDNNFWIITEQNIIAYNIKENTMESFNDESDSFKNLFTNEGFLSADGNIVLGTVDGYLWFNPDEIFTIDYTPRLAITKLILGIDNERELFNSKTPIVLDNREKSMEIHFSAIDFIGNSNISYFYKLDKGNWISNGNSRNVMFSHLSPGKHTFHIKSTNSYGKMCDNEVALSFRIKWPLMLRWWALLSYVMLIFFLIYAVKKQVNFHRSMEEEKKRQKIKEEKLSAKMDFFANLAHDFNSPLTVISSCSEHLSTAHGLNQEEKRFVKLIEDNSDRMAKLIQELLEFRKVDSGHFIPKLSTYDIVSQLKPIIEGYRLSYGMKAIKYELDIPESLYIQSDREAVERILMNLVSNAHKYVSDKGTVSISLAREENSIRLNIRNTGKGIESKDLEKFFDRYVLLDSFEKQVGDGSISRHGLGLALVKSLVDALEGTINVDSVREEYTEIVVTLPCGDIQIPKESSKASKISSLSCDPEKLISVMVVDDESDIREVISDTLKDRYNVIQAKNGVEALEILEYAKPKLIITDINMPQMNGVELIRRLRQDASTCYIPVIALSVKYDIDSQIESITTGAESFLPKPFKAKQLNALVDRLLESREDAKKYYSSSVQRYEQLFNKNVSVEDKKFVADAVRYIEENVDSDDLSTVLLADHMCTSGTTLYRRIKCALDISPVELIRLVKVSHAAYLLKSTNLTILEIMDQSGFKSRTYFYKVFAEQYNMTPVEYKNQD